MNFNDELQKRTETINGIIAKYAPRGNGLQKIIFDAANYSLAAGGKRIRPILTYSVCEMLGGNPLDAEHFLCAVEFIHTYSLIHDDLPCMDNDDFRRGILTNHKKFGEAIALLAGDTLLTYAFETAAKSKTEPQITVRAVAEIAKASGADGMIGGQVIDINGAKDYDELLTVHRLKTGALIKLSCRLGALCAKASDEDMAFVDTFAENLGIAFQIKDDILDVESTSEILGKPTGSDEKRGIQTYVTLFGTKGAEEKLEKHTKDAKDALKHFGENAEFLTDLSEYLLKRTK